MEMGERKIQYPIIRTSGLQLCDTFGCRLLYIHIYIYILGEVPPTRSVRQPPIRILKIYLI